MPLSSIAPSAIAYRRTHVESASEENTTLLGMQTRHAGNITLTSAASGSGAKQPETTANEAGRSEDAPLCTATIPWKQALTTARTVADNAQKQPFTLAVVSRQRRWPLVLAAFAAFASEICHWLSLPDGISAALALLAVVACGLTTYKKGWLALRQGTMNINALMSIAVTGALLLGQWPEAAMVMVLFTLAELIEARSLDRARNAIGGLLQSVPAIASLQ